MNLINNWMQPVTLAAGAAALDLDLADGLYRLSIADSATAPTRWEIVGASVASGQANLLRGLEGTLDHEWPEGSVIYAGVTAGMLGELYQRIAELEQRVTALESSGAVGIPITATLRSTQFGNTVNYYAAASDGAVDPATLTLPDGSTAGVSYIGYSTPWASFEVRFAAGVDAQAVVDQLGSLEVQGIGTLDATAAIVTPEGPNGPASLLWEEIPASDWPDLGTRTIRFIPL